MNSHPHSLPAAGVLYLNIQYVHIIFCSYILYIHIHHSFFVLCSFLVLSVAEPLGANGNVVYGNVVYGQYTIHMYNVQLGYSTSCIVSVSIHSFVSLEHGY